MKTKHLILLALTGSWLATTARAQVAVTITGSTAFRNITIDRAASLYDAGSLTAITNNASTGLITYAGTMSNAVPSVGVAPVKIRLSFSGSAAGMLSVVNSTPVTTAESPGVNGSAVPDLALSDVFPGSASPPIPDSAVDQNILGVIPFVYVRNNALAGITNITREQAVLLMTASGVATNGTQLVPGMPASYLGAANNNPIFMTGRDSGSGTRITTQRCIGFYGNPVLWGTNSSGAYFQYTGYPSGGLERYVIATKPDAIGYLGLSDTAAISAFATPISYQGVTFSPAAVANGSYALWGYEHIVNRPVPGGLSANQAAVRDALIAAITDVAFQTTNPIYTNDFLSLNQMNVERGDDGAVITSKNF